MSAQPTGPVYLALDIETTGLDRTKDAILEIAWRAVDANLEVIPDFPPFERVFALTANGMKRLIEAPAVVRTMHSASGLLGDVLGSKDKIDVTVSVLDSTLRRLHERFERVHLLGMSIHFDAEFLKHNGFAWLFDDARGIHHRMYDISSVKIALDQAGVEWKRAEKGNHRALADVDEAIEQARIFHALFGGLK